MHNQWISCCCCVMCCFTGLPVPPFSILCSDLSCPYLLMLFPGVFYPWDWKSMAAIHLFSPFFASRRECLSYCCLLLFIFPSSFFSIKARSIIQFSSSKQQTTTSVHLHGSSSSSSRRQFVTMGAHFWLPLLLLLRFLLTPSENRSWRRRGSTTTTSTTTTTQQCVLSSSRVFSSRSLTIGYMLLEKEKKFFIFRIFSSVFFQWPVQLFSRRFW